jgi:hypothetical protein
MTSELDSDCSGIENQPYRKKIERENEGELQQSREVLTLEDVCPTWARKIKFGLSKSDLEILSHDSKYCLVGEAWGFTGRQAGYYFVPFIPLIGCWKCIKYGQDMGKLAAEERGANNSSCFEPLIAQFLNHWNKEHRNITEKLRRQTERKNLKRRFI